MGSKTMASPVETALEAAAGTAVPEPVPAGFADRFGLDPWLLGAQVVNFLVVLAVLTRFVFRPLLATLRARSLTLERGIQEADSARALLLAAAAEKAEVLQAAARQGALKLRAAEDAAHRLQEDISRRAEAAAAAIHDRAEREASKLKSDTLRAAMGEVGELAVDVAEAALTRRLTEKDRAAYRAAALDHLQAKAR